MLTLAGFAVLLGCVFGSYILSGGSIGPLAEALPFELLTIGGAAICTFIMANSLHAVKHTLGGMMKVIKGATFTKRDYVDLLRG
ncbi:MAG TPA: motility-associated protein [Acidisphaera sp.]|nr:motility-associated protein [Acidisphaera sp.]